MSLFKCRPELSTHVVSFNATIHTKTLNTNLALTSPVCSAHTLPFKFFH